MTQWKPHPSAGRRRKLGTPAILFLAMCGVSRADLAHRMGTTVYDVTNWSRGLRPAPPELAAALADLLPAPEDVDTALRLFPRHRQTEPTTPIEVLRGAGFKVADVADALGIHRHALRKWFAGAPSATEDFHLRLAAIVGDEVAEAAMRLASPWWRPHPVPPGERCSPVPHWWAKETTAEAIDRYHREARERSQRRAA